MVEINKTRLIITTILLIMLIYRIWGIKFLEKIFGKKAYMKGLYEGGIDIGIVSLLVLLLYSFVN
ncbi:hypothetical protein NE479_01715 [Phascolarctobacterium faecium]|jgi:hypothetical protein|uniref:hypothetical protein n=1 Tax=Phascolarctobacterium faecium TaxID=33025 RepID=UPI00210A70A7|nr:hypothetical protein [Phascolarctobacterium faecium]MCQ4906283.1 hypothetical protein [Phascolarctobacterium faecium]